MANWWDNGLQGEYAMPCSTGKIQPALPSLITAESIVGLSVAGSYSLNTGVNVGNHYDVLMNTFSLGTQLYFRFTPYRWEGTITGYQGDIYPVTNITHLLSVYLKQGDQIYWIESGTARFDNCNSYITDAPTVINNALFNIYRTNYYRDGGKNGNPYPRGKESAVTTNQIAFLKAPDGLECYAVGYAFNMEVGTSTYRFDAPCQLLFKIRDTLLNNTNLFDPNVDNVTPSGDTGTGAGVGGNVPDLPVAPTYPGNDINFPSLPTGANAFGFSRLTLYKPTASQLADALDILYTDSDESALEQIIESCKKWWYKPDQYCISLMLSPVDATTVASKNIKFGKYDSQVSSAYVTNQYHIVDCGTISVPLKFGSFVDFEPHAKCKLYLPYVGFRTISANELVGGTIAIKYYIDILTGSSLAMVRISKEGSNNSILYTYECNTSVQVPLTANNYGQVVTSLLQASMTAASGNGIGAVRDAIGAAAAVGAPDVTQSGQLTSNSGVMSYPKPYLCIQFPVPTTPGNYNTEKGRPSNAYMRLGGCSGFTVISDMHIDIPGAYAEEIEEIRNAFKRGVYM